MFTKKQTIFLVLVYSTAAIIFSSIYSYYCEFGEIRFSHQYLINTIMTPKYFYIAISVLTFFIMYFQYKFYKKKLTKRENCQIQFVDIEKIAHTWLSVDDIIENKRNSEADTYRLTTIEADWEYLGQLYAEIKISNIEIITSYVNPYLFSYTKEELKIVFELLEYIEKNKSVSSVGMLFDKDADIVQYQKSHSKTVEETDYQILSNINIEAHTIRVIHEVFKAAMTNRINLDIFAPKLLIIAIGHDIGKIENSKIMMESTQQEEEIRKKLFTTHSHEHMSTIILGTMFPEYVNIALVNNVIISHHSVLKDDHKNSSSNEAELKKVLYQADKSARADEIKEYTIELKNKNTETSKANDKQEGNKQEGNTQAQPKSQLINDTNRNNILTIAKTVIDNNKQEENKQKPIEVSEKFKSAIDDLKQNLFKIEMNPSGRLQIKSIVDDKMEYFLFEEKFFETILKKSLFRITKSDYNQSLIGFNSYHKIEKKTVVMTTQNDDVVLFKNKAEMFIVPIEKLMDDKNFIKNELSNIKELYDLNIQIIQDSLI